MKTLMTKPLIALMALALCFAAVAQNQPAPGREQEQPDDAQPDPAELAALLLRQNAGGTNGDATAEQQAVNEALQQLLEARDALNAQKQEGENAKPGDERTPRPIRGQGTRGTTGSGTNAQSLASLLTNNAPSTHGTNGASRLRLNFRNAPLSLVLDYLSDAAGFVISANSKVDLQGKVTVWSNQLVDRNEAIALLNSALTSSGYAATVEGNLLNIYVVDATNTEIAAGVTNNNDYTSIPPTKDLVTQIVYVRNVEANQLISSLQPLMPSGTSIAANQGANAIVITDTKANIRRMVQIVRALDTSSVSDSHVQVFALTYADATALAQVVTQLFQADSSSQGGRNRGGFGGGFPGFGGFGGGGGDRGGGGNSGSQQAGRVAAAKVTAVADERSNSLVVSAADSQMQEIAKLVNDMDVNVDDLTELRVFRLRYADPQETADQLTSLFPDPTTQQNSRGNSQFGFRGFFGGGPGGNNRSSTTQSSRSTKQTRVTAVPDPRTGSVIVSASHETMGQIANIIDGLDSDPSKKKQVYVIPIANREGQEVMEELQSVIATDSSGGNLNTSRSSQRQSGSQLGTRQQNNLQNQGNNNNNGFNVNGGNSRTGR